MRHLMMVAMTLLGLAVAGGALTTAQAASQTAAEPEAAGVIVKFHKGTTLAEVGAALDDAQAAPARSTTLDGVALLEPDAGQTIDGAVAALEGNPDVAYAEPDYVVAIDAVPNDPLYDSQWAYPYIGLPTAWDRTTGSTSVVVAVVDTGVELADPELDGNLVAGYNAITPAGSANDDHGHGTHVAGTIAAESNNSAGVAGICWTCKIMPVKVLNSAGSGSMSDVAEGIVWAVANGADVINLSLGSTGASTTVQTSVDNAWAAGVIVVAAAGNNAADANTADDFVLYPAAYANAIAVGAFDSAGTRAPFSNYGPELDISAPGVGILSTVLGSSYDSWSGTSMATPHVAGVIGLMIASGMTDKDAIRSKLLSTATDAGTAGFDSYYGNGRLNAALAVLPQYGVTWGADTAASSMTTGTDATFNVSFTNAGSLTWVSSGTNRVNFSYHWKNGACSGTTTAVYDGKRTRLPSDTASGAAVSNLSVAVTPPAAAGTYCLVLDLVREGVTWFSSQGASTKTKTVTVSQPAYGVTWGSDTASASMTTGANASFNVSFTNAGSLTWASSGTNRVNFSYHWKNGACAGTTTAVWDGKRTGLPSDTASGTVSNLSVTVTAPASPGTYCLAFDLVREGVTWFSWQGASTKATTITVSQPAYGVTWDSDTAPASMTTGADASFNVSFTNAGSLTWASSGTNRVNFSYHWKNGACAGTTTAVWDGKRTGLPSDTANGAAVSNLAVTVTAPATPGTYCLAFDLVREGVTWFSWQGASTKAKTVTVQ